MTGTACIHATSPYLPRAVCAVVVLLLSLACLAQTQRQDSFSIHGRVLNAAGFPVAGATVHVEADGGLRLAIATDAWGLFSFHDLNHRNYRLYAETSELRSETVTIDLAASPEAIDLVLNRGSRPDASKASAPSTQTMDFVDEAKFSVAGVTDWTAAGGHGSDTNLRTSEALTRETLALKSGAGQGDGAPPAATSARESEFKAEVAKQPQSFEANHSLGEFYLQQRRYRDALAPLQIAWRIDAQNRANEYDLAVACEQTNDLSGAREHVQHLLTVSAAADVHRLAGEIDEKSGEPLAAVHEFELAAHQDPSEQNYFSWGSELLLHRAIWQAKDVLERGVKTHPRSERMLTGLGAALFAAALYDQAAQHLCEASDLNPGDPEPYMFMGKIESAAPNPLACVKDKLARFEREQPGNALANYFYAMALWKDAGSALDEAAARQVESMLMKAVEIDPKCSDAYLQLGNLNSLRRDYPRAIDLYTKAIESNPESSEAHYRLGVAYDRTGDKSRAAQEFMLHEKMEREQAAAVEKQRREVKQFIVVMPSDAKPAANPQ